MGLFSKLLDTLFGKKQPIQQTIEPVKPMNEHLDRWEQERQARIQSAEAELKDWLIESVKKYGSMSFTWESGNDEAFVTFADANDDDEGNFEDLEEYIIDKLDIPDAGEFQMTGSGTIYPDANLVKVKYSSILKEVVDFNEETEEEVYGEEVEQDSGDIVLFAIN